MRLERVRIKGYKSIVEWIDLKICKNIGTIIGQNGSGKTNILEAITIALKNIYYDDVECDFLYQLYFTLTKDEFSKFFPEFEYTQENSLLLISNEGLDSKILRLRSKKIELYKEKIFDAAQEYLSVIKKDLKLYKDTINEFQEMRDKYLRDGFKHRAVVSRYKVNTTTHETRTKINQIDTLLKVELAQDKSGIVSFVDGIYFDGLDATEYFRVKIEKRSIDDISGPPEMIQAYLEQSNKEVDEFNRRYDKLEEFMTQMRMKLDGKIFNFIKVVKESETKISSNDKLNSTFHEDVMKHIIKHVVFLNVSTNVSSGSDIEKTEEESLKNMNESDGFFAMVAPYLFEGKQLDEVQKMLTSYYSYIEFRDKVPRICQEFERFINSTISKITSSQMSVVVEPGKYSIELKIKEATGEIIELANTNTGRKMLFHYLFCRGILKDGDVFIIDEPAVFFHPEAQVELYSDMVTLAKERDITVIYATHSPYILGKEVEIINKIHMTSNGTVVTKVKTTEDMFNKFSHGLNKLTKAIW